MSKQSIKLDVERVRKLINLNFDARQYFFSKVDERWLDWLWDNGFFEPIKKKAEDPTKYGYKMPELSYLVRISEKYPQRVAEIILDKDVAASKDNFNPEVVDRFLYISSTLPASELSRVVMKIRKENWVSLMSIFNHWGFEYEKMLKELANAKDYEGLLVLSEAILSVKQKSEDDIQSISYNPFYINELQYTKVFEYLASVDNQYAEQALGLATKIIANVVSLVGEKNKEATKVFDVYDRFLLLNIDFFTLNVGQSDYSSGRDNIRELAAVIKKLSEKTIGATNISNSQAKDMYNKYFKPLPDSRSMWRLKLFVLTLHPEFFKEELKNQFWKLFDADNYSEIISGAEYERALKKGFAVLSEADKHDYIKKVIEYFKKKDQDKENEKENWHLRHGSEILSLIEDHMTADEREETQKAGFVFDPDYEPEPSIGKMRGGTVVPRGPITEQEFNQLPIEDISAKMRNEWTPEKLVEQNTSDDFLRPLNAEGVGDLLRKDIPKRLQEYVNKAYLFFDRISLDPHYTYSYLRGIQELIRGEKMAVREVDWQDVISLFVSIKKSGEAEVFDQSQRERRSFDAWLAGWTAVHSAITDVIQELLKEDNGTTAINFSKHRDELFGIIAYLLNYNDPTPADEKLETTKIKVKSPEDPEYSIGDPFTSAINTVRGRALDAFGIFIYQDGKQFDENQVSKISADSKELYENVLVKENTLAVMFMFGHHVPAFYFRDTPWLHGLLSKIFSTDEERKDLYLAAWEGYLSRNLFSEIFSDQNFVNLYSRAIALSPHEYTKRKYFRELDEGLSTHLALAFLYFENFNFDHELFKSFWSIKNTKRFGGFISFIGRHYISGEDKRSSTSLTKEQIIERLKKFWDWALENIDDPEALTEFGYWMNTEKDMFEKVWLAGHIRKTLEKTQGDVEWEYRLMKSIVALAKEAPEDTIQILRLYLTNLVNPKNRSHGWIYVDSEVLEALRILYSIPSIKERVRTLINDLITIAGERFWKLKEVIND
ncbi:MAG: hypothetical protein A3B11_00870 [Candidatus Taylorbacteria bacterium RIFCSPLOWO2_01_FULL_44_26]|uniref:Uncharacterized protein n=2 Tax=Parcubacteria group TaxID=1794811 RepID=A0A1G2N5N6_9BACT|nr:MAG: hypothetical protein A2647_01285 [Candidatus Nomurabacteria bacterium RIFCSPHIGHO2_01_FULL_40_24b]OHA31497.1 MAG: hypothetical protein A3B11_00870 [Candidatus Taylorbacteria bacterium RIFCSPLOWO2_01_FULL_44_26]